MDSKQDIESELSQLRERVGKMADEAKVLRQRDWYHQGLIDTISAELDAAKPRIVGTHKPFNGLSLIIAYYDIPQQIERTLLSCSPEYQGAGTDEIEVILVDNGSNLRPAEDLQERYPHVTKIIRTEGNPSPVFAMNAAIQEARFDMIGLLIDGAHMLSPGILQNVREVSQLFSRPVINVPQYILGQVSQNIPPPGDAYRREQRKLDAIGWPENGYKLFDFCLYPGESLQRSYYNAIESSCLITTRDVLKVCGAYDVRFDEPGAGFANLEIFTRLIHHPESTYIVLSGEGSFHQDHGGTTTGLSPQQRDALVKSFRERHKEVTGSDLLVNVRSPFTYGLTRRSSQRIPTISREYGRARNRILKHLAEICISRAAANMTNSFEPQLVIGGFADERKARTVLSPLGLIDNVAEKSGTTTKNVAYMNYLQRIHMRQSPELYFEIGVDTGASLALSNCKSIGVDPAYMISNPVPSETRLFRITSDAFFADRETCQNLLSNGIDLSYIDGMHLAEYVLRDFINVERHMKPSGQIVLDDVLPEQMEMAERNRRFNAWCGDVYKIVPILRKYRPDLTVHVYEAFIGPYRKGIATVTQLDPANTVLADNVDIITKEILGDTYAVDSIEALETLVGVSPYSHFDGLT